MSWPPSKIYDPCVRRNLGYLCAVAGLPFALCLLILSGFGGFCSKSSILKTSSSDRSMIWFNSPCEILFSLVISRELLENRLARRSLRWVSWGYASLLISDNAATEFRERFAFLHMKKFATLFKSILMTRSTKGLIRGNGCSSRYFAP